MINERITTEVADTVCKMGQGAACCRYLSIGASGWSCLKHSDMKDYLDMRVARDALTSKADNCEGRPE